MTCFIREDAAVLKQKIKRNHKTVTEESQSPHQNKPYQNASD
jgi:hypothetical protein